MQAYSTDLRYKHRCENVVSHLIGLEFKLAILNMAFLSNSVLTDEVANKDVDSYILSVCFSPDGKFLATGGQDTVIWACILFLHMSNPYSSKLIHHTMFLYTRYGTLNIA